MLCKEEKKKGIAEAIYVKCIGWFRTHDVKSRGVKDGSSNTWLHFQNYTSLSITKIYEGSNGKGIITPKVESLMFSW
jgi:hypothetical protein